MQRPLINYIAPDSDYRYITSTGHYSCCGAGVWAGFQNNPFHLQSDNMLTAYGAKKNYGYMIDVVAPVDHMNKVWEWEGWEPRTWHKQLRNTGFELVAVFDGLYDGQPTQLAYYHMNVVKKEEV